jgi:hypothetical protein
VWLSFDRLRMSGVGRSAGGSGGPFSILRCELIFETRRREGAKIPRSGLRPASSGECVCGQHRPWRSAPRSLRLRVFALKTGARGGRVLNLKRFRGIGSGLGGRANSFFGTRRRDGATIPRSGQTLDVPDRSCVLQSRRRRSAPRSLRRCVVALKIGRHGGGGSRRRWSHIQGSGGRMIGP